MARLGNRQIEKKEAPEDRAARDGGYPSSFGDAQLANLGRCLRALREQRGWALKDLSEVSELSVTTLHRLESGNTNPGLLTLVRVLDALGVSLDNFVKSALEGTAVVQVVRARRGSQRAQFVEQTVAEIADGHLRASMMTLPPQTDMVAPDRRGHTAHFAFVIEGKLILVLDNDQTLELTAGDAVHILEPSIRLLSNRAGRSARLLWVDDVRPSGSQ